MRKNRIKYALHLSGWEFSKNSKSYLRANGARIPPNEYTQDMKGQIFCPECCVNLYRNPRDKSHDRSGRDAFYAHAKSPAPYCTLRVKRPVGKRYENEEEAAQAIEDNELLIVQGFMLTPPILPETNSPAVFEARSVEEANGELTEITIGRHDGEAFKLPSKITTVRGLCRNFDVNYYRYLALPGQNSAIQLKDLLIDTTTVTEPSDTPRLYYGKIKNLYSPKEAPHNIRMTELRYKQNEQKDFYLKATNALSDEHGINLESVERIVLMYGIVTVNGMGLCIENLGWGELALLPKKYEYLLI